MPIRGSVKVLLPSLRPRATFGWGLGATAIALLLVGAVQLKAGSLDKSSFAQAVRQSVWNQALDGRSQTEHWPWEDLSISMSLVPTAKVPRLGLSASLLKPNATADTASARPRRAGSAYIDDTGRGDVALGDVASTDAAIGDSITFTAADGATCVYKVTRRRVVDPHLAGSEAERTDSGSPFSCGPLDDLIRDASQGKVPIAPPPAADQQKL
jgi:hypothetical protein